MVNDSVWRRRVYFYWAISLETIKTLSPNGAPHKQSFDRQTDKCKRTDGLIDYL